jgi:hypothetical protein
VFMDSGFRRNDEADKFSMTERLLGTNAAQ